MKTVNLLKGVIVAFAVFYSGQSYSQSNESATNNTNDKMKTYVIERTVPNAGALSPEELKNISAKSCGVLNDMGPSIQWIHSYVAGDKIFCIYKAESEALIREHGQKGGFPVDAIYQLSAVISPETATAKVE